jgi:TPR repeat protein
MYKYGWGVPKDDAQAVVWWRKAADQGDPEAQNALGFMYVVGEGVPKDYAHALSWFHKSAAQGFPNAQTAIGSMYRDGYGVPKDYAQAEIWYRKAIAQGYEDAKKKLAALKRESVAGNEQGLAVLQIRCALETRALFNPGPETDKRIEACKRAHWKEVLGSTPYPGD